jgi:hypothetical protein
MPLLRPLKSRRWSRFEIRIPTDDAPKFERDFAEVRKQFDPALSEAEVARRIWLAGVASLLAARSANPTKTEA